MTTKPSASIARLCFSGGEELYFRPNDKIILVGPNNSGKSQTLREIVQIAKERGNTQSVVLKKIDFKKLGTAEDLQMFLEENADYRGEQYLFKNWAININNIKMWEHHSNLPHNLANGFIKIIDANDRLKISEQQESIGRHQQKSKPQHILYDDPKLMERISGLFKQAFGKDLMFDFRVGKYMPIHVGDKPDPKYCDRIGDPYVDAVRENPLLDQQGDGMKSYAGILFETIVADLDINLLDEPEAFLHPPQMRRLGETLASEVSGQLIVATHSSDIMRGFLEGTRGQVRILRIRRVEHQNRVSEASPDVIKELWAQPELRYSNALEGIFHEQTIICEDDSDCRLFNAIADYLAMKDDQIWKDTVYVPTGGKHGVRKVADILRKIGVPIKAVFDIDFLSERALVKETVTAFGGKWEDFSTLWERVDAAVRDGVRPPPIDEIKAKLIRVAQEYEDEKLLKGEINQLLKQTSAWNMLKKFGKAAIPNGEAQAQFSDLKTQLEKIGIYVVHVGEIENFIPELGSHGPKFVHKLLAEVRFDDDRLEELRRFTSIVHNGNHAPLPET